jgi:CheY-like chemotaxis protein
MPQRRLDREDGTRATRSRMSREATELLPPRIAVVDDERQIHASIRLRLGKDCEVVSFADTRLALEAVAEEKFDLCFVDIHMPHLDGLTFIERAKERDPGLGYVVLSAFDTDENLRRAIPLQVYDFLSKPLPERDGFERRLPDWVARTRQRRRADLLAHQASTLDRDLDSARLEREVELVAAESARDALLQTANLLTTVHAHLVTASSLTAARAKTDPSLAQLLRNLELGLKTADAAVTVAEGFFDSAYGHRDASPALVDAGLRHAISIASRMSRSEDSNKTIDFPAADEQLPIYGLSGIDFLLMTVPAVGLSLTVAGANSTVRVRTEPLLRLEVAGKDARYKNFLWLNRRNAISSRPGVLITVTTNAPAFSRSQVEGWLKSDTSALSSVTARGLVLGIQKCRGLLGLALTPTAEHFQLVLALPT